MRFEQTIHIGPEETTDYQLHYAGKVRYWISAGLGLAGAFLVAAFCWDSSKLLSSILMVLGCGCFFSFLVLYTLKYTVARQVKAQYEKGEHKEYDQTITLDGFGLTVSSGKKTRRFDYSQLHQVDETGKYFFFFIKANQAYTLPKAQLNDPKEDVKTIRSILNTFIVGRQLHLKK